LRLDSQTPVDGRLLSEALRDWTEDTPAWQSNEVAETFTARGRDWIQRLWFEQIGTTSYLAGGAVEAA
jgi:hypothetical protein